MQAAAHRAHWNVANSCNFGVTAAGAEMLEQHHDLQRLRQLPDGVPDPVTQRVLVQHVLNRLERCDVEVERYLRTGAAQVRPARIAHDCAEPAADRLRVAQRTPGNKRGYHRFLNGVLSSRTVAEQTDSHRHHVGAMTLQERTETRHIARTSSTGQLVVVRFNHHAPPAGARVTHRMRRDREKFERRA